ncbi:MAG TPA: Uma2 family endonuclease [Polyangiaceae bacterium]|nr:Uma2 family endonuclease [Polyangiaceae bacterium]
MTQPRWPHDEGPLPTRIDELREGDRYELSEGRAVYCAPAQFKHGGPHVVSALPLASDPSVTEIGADVGHVLGDRTLRAPDLSVGEMGAGDGGWATKAPPLAIELASQGQDEADLQLKIKQLLAAGTRFVWVVRLLGPRRVEVYERGRAVKTKLPGERLEAPGILKNPPLVEALYDPDASFEHTLQNLLERKGYAGLDAVRAEAAREGREQGRREGEARGEARGKEQGLREGEAKGKAAALLTVLAARGLAVDDATRGRIEACADAARLDRWLARALTAASAREAVDEPPTEDAPTARARPEP